MGQRLFLAVLPAIVGVLAVAGLAYWGKYGRQAPEAIIIIAVCAALISLGMAWYNTRYVARRVEHLVVRTTGKASPDSQPPRFRDLASAVTGGVISHSGTADELDTIESTVYDLNSAVRRAREDGDHRAQRAEAREAEYTAIIDEVTHLMVSWLDEAQLPIHVLLSSPFGSLNENQEEMLSTAQTALDAADGKIRQLRALLTLDRGALTTVPQPVGLTELLKPALAIADARGRKAHVTVAADVSEMAPRVVADPLQVQAALTTILTNAVSQTPAGGEVKISAGEGEHGQIRITVQHGGTRQPQDPATPTPLDMRLARRLLGLQQGALLESPGQLIVDLPSETLVSTTRGMIQPKT
ncbi:MAG TPA: hypothetical protein VNU46_06705 [Gemmatimonadaceae bacterium]|nr:hypothetical protein [Gemmatimonadaceae bacterium]